MAHADRTGDKRLVGYVVGRKAEMIDVVEIRKSLRQQLPEYMVPAVLLEVDGLPLTPNGKIDRKSLPAPEVWDWRGEYVPPQTEMETLLAEIWASVLGMERVGRTDNFFEIGGHSLLATQVVSRVREVLEIDLPLRALFEAPTVGELSTIILSDPHQRTRVEKIAQLRLRLAHLSDDEVEALLDGKAAPPEPF